ncbi:hypothetical protein VNO77_15262 [Canavalia gladiata]|uniref:Small acidic protein-like domain-containing protein n=1 Tax=Canavalia gladiata TaxID=3824 RepID=A0AAN9QP40_CANGL
MAYVAWPNCGFVAGLEDGMRGKLPITQNPNLLGLPWPLSYEVHVPEIEKGKSTCWHHSMDLDTQFLQPFIDQGPLLTTCLKPMQYIVAICPMTQIGLGESQQSHPCPNRQLFPFANFGNQVTDSDFYLCFGLMKPSLSWHEYSTKPLHSNELKRHIAESRVSFFLSHLFLLPAITSAKTTVTNESIIFRLKFPIPRPSWLSMMDSNLPSPPHGSSDTKNAFRKPSGDAACRNYRRRSPVEGSPSPDGSPRNEHSSSPNPGRENSARVSHHHSRKYDSREQDRQYGRNHYGRSTDSLRHFDRLSSKSSYSHFRHDRYANEDRPYERLSSRSGHESRDDHKREESDSRSKSYQCNVDKYWRDKYDTSDHRSKEKHRETCSEHQKYKDVDSSYNKTAGKRHALYDKVEKEGRSRDWDGLDEKRDSRRSSGDYRSDRAVSYSESRNQRDDSGSQRNSGKFSLREACKSEPESNETEIGNDRDWKTGKVGEQFGIEDKESSGKKLKLFHSDKDDNYGKDDESKTSSSKLSPEKKADFGAAKTSGFDGDNDLDAAKNAAMRAAELVNRNLVGAGCLTTDQKKKLLWGGKKSTPTEESGHRWDTAMFSDRERQEKFNKLMGMKGDAKADQNSNNQSGNDILRAEKQKELQLDLEKQYTAGLRRRDGRTVGLGL